MWLLVLAILVVDAEPRTKMVWYGSEVDCVLDGEKAKEVWQKATKGNHGHTVYQCLWLPPCEKRQIKK